MVRTIAFAVLLAAAIQLTNATGQAQTGTPTTASKAPTQFGDTSRTDGSDKYEGTRKMALLLKDVSARFHVSGNMFANKVRAKFFADLVKVAPENEWNLCQEYLFAGMTEQGIAEIQVALAKPGLNPLLKAKFQRLLALGYLRQGEVENCVMNHTAQSCLFPIEKGGVHTIQRGSRAAIEVYTAILNEYPDDITSRWLLNIAYQTLGEYPDKVPPQWLYPPELFRSEYPLPRFTDIAPALGIDIEDLSGGCCTEDFDLDGDIDILASSLNCDKELAYYRNNGDGTFTDRSSDLKLDGITGGLNMFHADYNNDGYPDVFVTRGAWFGAYGNQPKSLLRNNGDGSFTDVTIEAGLLSVGASEVAAWGDIDNDGLLDLFVGNESTYSPIPCNLYHNNGDGTFTDIGHAAGLDMVGMTKAASWGDFDNDGLIDLYVSMMGGQNHLMKNNGKKNGTWTFTDVAQKAGVQLPMQSFPSFFFDYDNDGWLDIFSCDFGGNSAGSINGLPIDMNAVVPTVNDYLGKPHQVTVPALYHNNHNGTFTDVAQKMHLDKTMFGMGCNFGDIDNDGWLDIYVGTGHPYLDALIPNRMFRNAEGKVFQDVTTAGGFGHLQKGHAIAFADIDNDGDQDIYAVMGGALEGDVARKVLFQNPGNANHWITIIPQGVKANRCGIGARIKVTVQRAGGAMRDIYVNVCTGGSFGSSTLQQEIGLGDAQRIASVSITWPGTPTPQVLKDVPMDRAVKIREGSSDIVTVERHPIAMPSADAAADHHHHME